MELVEQQPGEQPPSWLVEILERQHSMIANSIAIMADRISHLEETRTYLTPSRTLSPTSMPPLETAGGVLAERPRPKPQLPYPEQFIGEDLSLYPQFEGLLRAKLQIDGEAIGGDIEQAWYAFGRLSGAAATRVFP
ncbi:hypothetical protein B0J14DRAFT_606750 [Halenospora varia]|nr:hypothetical protein B0J14DRAFT_606750 [Halenospora varia]